MDFAQDSPNATWSQYQIQHGGVLKGNGTFPPIPDQLVNVVGDIARAGEAMVTNLIDTIKKTYTDLRTLYENGGLTTLMCNEYSKISSQGAAWMT